MDWSWWPARRQKARQHLTRPRGFVASRSAPPALQPPGEEARRCGAGEVAGAGTTTTRARRLIFTRHGPKETLIGMLGSEDQNCQVHRAKRPGAPSRDPHRLARPPSLVKMPSLVVRPGLINHLTRPAAGASAPLRRRPRCRPPRPPAEERGRRGPSAPGLAVTGRARCHAQIYHDRRPFTFTNASVQLRRVHPRNTRAPPGCS